MHIFRLWRKHVQSCKKITIKLYEELCSRGSPCLYIEGEKWLSSQCGKKVTKNYLTIISKPHAHPHTTKKMHAKFHNNRYKTVRGIALTRGTNCLYIKGEKRRSSQCGKSDKKCSNNYIQTTCTSSYHEENICKVSKQSVQNCKRSCTHKRYPLSIYWGWKMTKFTMWKKNNKKCSNNYIQTTCTSSYHEKNICKVSKWSVQNCKRSCAHKRYPLSIYWGWKMTKFTMWKKWQKNF